MKARISFPAAKEVVLIHPFLLLMIDALALQIDSSPRLETKGKRSVQVPFPSMKVPFVLQDTPEAGSTRRLSSSSFSAADVDDSADADADEETDQQKRLGPPKSSPKNCSFFAPH